MVAPVPAHISKLPRRKFSCPSRRSIPNSRPVNRLQPLGAFSVAPVLCFQQLAASFPKILRWGVPRFPFQLRNTHYPLSTFVNSFVSYHMHVSQAFSCNYALFCATARRYLPYFQEPAHSFDRHRGWGGIGWYISQGLLEVASQQLRSKRLAPIAAQKRQPGGPVRAAGCRRCAGRRCGQARRCLPSPAMDALRPPIPALPLSSDAHRATRRGFGWPPGSGDAYSELLQPRRFNRALAAQLIRALAAQLYGRRPDRFCAAATGVPSSGSSADALALALENADRSTSFAKKFFPSIGTIMICNLSESRSAIIFW